jgi:hypothetical protein
MTKKRRKGVGGTLYLRERDRLEGRPGFLEDLRFFSLLTGNGTPRQPWHTQLDKSAASSLRHVMKKKVGDIDEP